MKNVDKNDTLVDRVRLNAGLRRLSLAILFGSFCLLFAANSFAQSSNRWLFVFNTSAAMRDRAAGVQGVTQDLLTTAMHGTIRPGDSIGIWTYDAVLKAEEAPLQIWSPKAAPSIAENTLQFLSHHPYEKTAVFDDVMANLLRVIKISDLITVVLISDGSDSIKGTPFDQSIATFYKTNYQPQKKAHMPVITVFRGENGVLTTNTLALAPWPIDIPVVPPPPVAKAVVQKPAPVAPAAKPVPSLVIIGKKAEMTFNPPTESPEHAGEPAPQPPTVPTQAELPAVTKAEPPVASTPTSAPESAPAPKVEEKPKASPAPVISDSKSSVAMPVATPAQSSIAAAEPQKPAPAPLAKVDSAPATNPPTETAVPPSHAAPQTATVTPTSNNLFTARNIAIVSVVFTLLVCTLLILSARNAQRAARSSLITRSLDRERK